MKGPMIHCKKLFLALSVRVHVFLNAGHISNIDGIV